MMNKYDKPFKPQIDARLTRLLFEPATPMTAVMVRSNIIDILNRYEPRAKINDVVVIFNEDTNTFEVTISFMLLNTRENSKVFVTIERLR
jgi:phage baseplate assembly protein W